MAKESKIKNIDITESGPMTYRQLQEANSESYTNLSPEFKLFSKNVGATTAPTSLYDAREFGERNIKSSLAEQSTPWGESIFDEPTATEEQFQNLGDIRADNQPWYSQIGAGLAKGAILAGTTFLDGTLGLLFGTGTAINEGRLSGIWDNDFSKAMQSVNEWSEEVLPNYYTKDEQEQPWYENIFTANFLGDKFIKNLGFTVGAFYSGGVTAAGLKATKLPQIIGAIAKSSKAPAIVTSGVGSVISAVNEGRIEALNNSKDWFELQKAQLDGKYNKRLEALEQYAGTEMYDTLLAQERANYEAAIGRLSEDRLKMGNADLLMNIPILTASNIIQFGKMYANGFKTARKATNIVGKVGEYTTDRTVGKGVTRAILNPLSEGLEEISQGAASRISGNYYEDDVNNFYKAKINPQAEQETLSWMKSFAQGINETVNDGSSWEEFFIGSLTGALGMPRFRGIRNNEGGLQSPITLEGGTLGEFREYKEKMGRDTEIANYMNSRVQSPEFRNYYQGLIRHNKYQNDMNQAVENNDEFEFKNAEHAQLVSDITMFDNAGKLEDLKILISSAYDTSDENLASIVENTTSILDNGDLVGPFAEYAIKNEDGTITSNFGNEESKQNMIKKLTQNKDDMLNTIKQYQTIKDNIDIRTGQQLNDEQLEELTFIQSQINNWQSRRDDMISLIEQPIREELSNWEDLYSGLEKLLQSKNSKQFVKNLTPSNLKTIVEEILPESDLSATDIMNIVSTVNDVVKVQKGIEKYNNKLREYLENPTKLQKDIINSTENIAKEEANKKSNDLKSRLIAATNLSEFRQVLNEEEDDNIKYETLNTLEEENYEMAKNYREVNAYNNDVQRAISSLEDSPIVKADALKLLQDQFENSSNLSEIANPNSVYVDNADALYDDSLTPEENAVKFQEAQYALLRAMNQINNENRFKDRFSKEYRELREKGTPNLSAPEKDTTGDSGTSTVPSVNGEGLPVTTYEPPVGNVTSTQVSDENKQSNERTETTQSFDSKQKGRRPYYRPSIPELHIEGTKEGDFRPFNVVAAEREKGVNFDEIYNYLKDNGAFTYVNEGNLKAGDELGFMIDPSFNNQTIFIVDKRNNQIVGSLDESQYSVDRYEGLAGLEEKIRTEFANREVDDPLQLEVNRFLDENPTDAPAVRVQRKFMIGYIRASRLVENWENHKPTNTGRFIATPTTRVSQVMVGKIPYGTEERSLANIPNVSGEGRTPIFGIIKNGTLSTNNKLNDSLIIKPVDISQKEGRMYLLIPNAAGKYSPAAVRVKHFNREEFNPEDIEIQNTQVFKNIQESINALANSLSEEDLNDAVKSLKSNLYTGDLHIDWFTSDRGNGIRFTKVQRDSQGNEVYEAKDGKRLRKEEVKTLFLTEKWDNNTLFTITEDSEVNTTPSSKSIDDIVNEVTNILLDFNLPIQVNLGMLNRGGYNNMLVNSNILTSNISDARVLSSWFTTDYFDNEGNLHQAISPASVTPQPIRKVETPVGGKESAIPGIPILLDNKEGNASIYVDLTSNTIRNNFGREITSSLSVEDKQRYFDLAWAQDNFGDSTQSSMMVDNKVLTPNGEVLDRSTQKYLYGKEAQEVKDRIAGREASVQDSKKVIAQIAENQKRVDKTRTNGEFYYILEDDGQYHEYERVHSRLGSNWTETSTSSTNSQRALSAGTAVDSVIRNFFTSNDTPIRPDNMSEKAFKDLITSLTEIRSNIEARGERFLTNNIVLFQKYPDGRRVAGEVDILSVDADGNFRIYDVKTSRYSFYDFTDKYGHKVNYFNNKSATQVMSSKDYYTLQLSAYQNLFESQYHTPITTLAILPFVLNYNKDIVDGVTKEKGIMITYNPNVNVPLVGAVKASEPTPTNSIVSVFNSALETQDPVNNVLPEFSLEDGKIGYFIVDGKLHKSYLSPIGQVNGVEVYMTKVPVITKGFGRKGEEAHVASNSYMAVFPNGNSITLIKNDPMTLTEQQAKDTIKKMLNGNPQRVVDMSNEKTLIFDPVSTPKVEAPKIETPSNILSTPSTTSGAAKAAQAEQAVNNKKVSRVRHTLRIVDNESRPVWNQEKELDWINKVLPQLSDDNKIRVVKGLIRVGNQGALAWGQFNNGIITLSDIAAEGTTYHEAFHAVFNLLLDSNERQALLSEAKEMYGNKSDLDLEEDMAEGFREYIMSRENRGIGRKILDFFKDLLAKVTNWNRMKPHLIDYYRNINEGKYSSSTFKVPTLSQMGKSKKKDITSFESLDAEIQEILLKKGWTQEQFNSISQDERDQAVKCIAI